MSNLLEYHIDIDQYIFMICCYQAFVKPYNDKLTLINLKERIKLTTIIIIFATFNIFVLIGRKIKHLKK